MAVAFSGKPWKIEAIFHVGLKKRQVEGMLTVVVAIAFVCFFPRSTERPISILGVRYFTEHESRILTARVQRDDPTKVHEHVHVKKEEFKATVSSLSSFHLSKITQESYLQPRLSM